MMSVSNKLANILIKVGTIKYDDKDLYVYGIHQAFLSIVNMATTVLIGFAFGMILESIIFLFAYIPIWTYAGGYHSKTTLRCYLFSIVIIVAALLTIKLIPWTGFICSIITLGAGLVIWFLAPVEDSNKPLSQKEIAVYKKRAYIILCILVLIALICWFIGCSFVSVSISVALSVLSVMLVLGKVKDGFSLSLSGKAED